jgi:hypothetical protein
MTGVGHAVAKMRVGTHGLLFGVLLRFPCLGHLSVDENTKGKPMLPSPALAAEGMSQGQLPAVPSTGNVAAVTGRGSGALQDPEITNVHPL